MWVCEKNIIGDNQRKSILHFVGSILIFLGLVLLIPIVVSLIYHENYYILPFLFSSLISLFIGLFLRFYFKKPTKISIRNAMFFSSGIWFIVVGISALPFYLSGDLSYLDGFFEAMSGYTTTGFTMYLNVDNISFTMNFWRGFMQWLGGLGILFIILTVIHTVTSGSRVLYKAEGRSELILHTVKETTRYMFLLYLGFTVCGIIAFVLCGMPLFDSIFYTFVAIASGGFAMANNTLLIYNNLWTWWVAIVIMIIGATNFSLYYFILKGNWREYFKDDETKLFLTLLLTGTIFLTGMFMYSGVYGENIFMSFNYAIFHVVSAVTTTGLQITSSPFLLQAWPGITLFTLTIFMIIGGGSTSTAGGIKWDKIVIMIKGFKKEIKKLSFPENAIVNEKFHHKKDILIDDKLILSTLLFICLYVFVYLISVFIGFMYSNDLSSVMFELASALGNVGLSCGFMTPSSPVILKVLFIIDLWLGRLEIWPILLLLTSYFIRPYKTKHSKRK